MYAGTTLVVGEVGQRHEWKCLDCGARSPITEGKPAFAKCRAALTMAESGWMFLDEPTMMRAINAARTSMLRAEGKGGDA